MKEESGVTKKGKFIQIDTVTAEILAGLPAEEKARYSEAYQEINANEAQLLYGEYAVEILRAKTYLEEWQMMQDLGDEYAEPSAGEFTPRTWALIQRDIAARKEEKGSGRS